MLKHKKKMDSVRLATVLILTFYLVQTVDCFLRKTERQVAQQEFDTGTYAGVQEGKIVFEKLSVLEHNKDTSKDSADEDLFYQADFQGWSTELGDQLEKDKWRKMATSLHCFGDHMKFRSLGPGASQFEVEQDEQILPLSMVPSKCGYKFHETVMVFIVLVPYGGCNMVEQDGDYKLPLRWKGHNLSLLCPKSSVASGPKLYKFWPSGPQELPTHQIQEPQSNIPSTLPENPPTPQVHPHPPSDDNPQETQIQIPPTWPQVPIYLPNDPNKQVPQIPMPPTWPQVPIHPPTNPGQQVPQIPMPPAWPQVPIHPPTNPSQQVPQIPMPPTRPQIPIYPPTDPSPQVPQMPATWPQVLIYPPGGPIPKLPLAQTLGSCCHRHGNCQGQTSHCSKNKDPLVQTFPPGPKPNFQTSSCCLRHGSCHGQKSGGCCSGHGSCYGQASAPCYRHRVSKVQTSPPVQVQTFPPSDPKPQEPQVLTFPWGQDQTQVQYPTRYDFQYKVHEVQVPSVYIPPLTEFHPEFPFLNKTTDPEKTPELPPKYIWFPYSSSSQEAEVPFTPLPSNSQLWLYNPQFPSLLPFYPISQSQYPEMKPIAQSGQT